VWIIIMVSEFAVQTYLWTNNTLIQYIHYNSETDFIPAGSLGVCGLQELHHLCFTNQAGHA